MSTIGATCASKMLTDHVETPERKSRWDSVIDHHWHADFVKHESPHRWHTEIKYDAQRKLLNERLGKNRKRVNPETPWAEYWPDA